MKGHDIIVMGASAGGVEALSKLVASLPADLPAAIFIVLHIPAEGTSVLPRILNRAGVLPAQHPVDGQPIDKGQIYIAPPDQHLLVQHGSIQLTRGPRENGHRPAVDMLFRSAARSYGRRVIAVILSGALDDGTAGMVAVKVRKGLCVVQEPADALYTGMPQSAIDNVPVDHVVPLAQMGALLAQLTQLPIPDESVNDEAELIEMEIDVAELEEQAMHEEAHPVGRRFMVAPNVGGRSGKFRKGR